MNKFIALFFLLCGFSPHPALAQDAPASQKQNAAVETVLDRLEQHLLDQESEGLRFDTTPKAADATKEEKKAVTTYEYKKQTIEAANPQADKLKDVAVAITEMEAQVDQLASEVQKAKQKVLENAKTDNFVEIEARLADTDKAGIRMIAVRLDGYDVYSLNEASGLWMPASRVPLYAGPLQPGNHRLDIEARMVMRIGNALPVNNDVYKQINQSFTVLIPPGAVKKHLIVHLLPPKDLDGNATAELTEAAPVKEK